MTSGVAEGILPPPEEWNLPMLTFTLRHALCVTSLAFVSITHASSFDCASAASPVEKAICADPYLSDLDEKLGAVWKTTLAKVADPTALKASQRQWLKNRSACGQEPACLRRDYLMRLTELEYATKPFNWNATWQRIPGTPSSGATLNTKQLDTTHISFDISAAEGGNSGDLDGVALLKGNQANYVEGQCAVSFTAVNGILNVTQDGSDGECSAGMGVYYSGTYVASDQPLLLDYDLLSLGLARSSQENAALHALLKNDYQVMVNLAGSIMEGDPSADVPGSKVTRLWVRGLGATSILMNTPDARLWVMLMTYDVQGNPRVRYYTNVSQWKGRLPDVMQAWHKDTYDGTLPLDFMP